MARYAEKEVRFNVMAIVGDRLAAAERRSDHLAQVRQAVMDRLSGSAEPRPELASEVPSGHEELQARLHSLESELASLQGEMQVGQKSSRPPWERCIVSVISPNYQPRVSCDLDRRNKTNAGDGRMTM